MTTNEEWHSIIRDCIKSDPNYNEIVNLTGDMGLYDIESKIIAEMTNQLQEVERQARIEALIDGVHKGYLESSEALLKMYSTNGTEKNFEYISDLIDHMKQNGVDSVKFKGKDGTAYMVIPLIEKTSPELEKILSDNKNKLIAQLTKQEEQ